jgi:hypothetical protein
MWVGADVKRDVLDLIQQEHHTATRKLLRKRENVRFEVSTCGSRVIVDREAADL